MSARKANTLHTSIKKSIKSDESAIPLHHVRTVVIQTYQPMYPEYFWDVISKQPLTKNHIITWKFCQLLHKVLLKGHTECIKIGVNKINFLKDIGQHWNNYRGIAYDGYGECIEKYTKLLITKIEFHDRNKMIPSSLTIARDNLESAFGDNAEERFQLAVELFDYLSDIIELQKQVFHTNLFFAIAPVRECRFMALTTLIEESKLLYFHLVQVIHRAHMQLPFSTLKGHRDRFLQIFKEIKTFYEESNKLDMIKDIIWIPSMSDTPPSFSDSNLLESMKFNESPQILEGNRRYSYAVDDATKQNGLRNNHRVQFQSMHRLNQITDDSLDEYDSDFSTDSEDDDGFNKDIGRAGREIMHPTAPPLEQTSSEMNSCVEQKDREIKQLKRQIELLEIRLEKESMEKIELKKQLDVYKKRERLSTAWKPSLPPRAPYYEEVKNIPVQVKSPPPPCNNFNTQTNNCSPIVGKEQIVVNTSVSRSTKLDGSDKNQLRYSVHNTVSYSSSRVNGSSGNYKKTRPKSAAFSNLQSFWNENDSLLKYR